MIPPPFVCYFIGFCNLALMNSLRACIQLSNITKINSVSDLYVSFLSGCATNLLIAGRLDDRTSVCQSVYPNDDVFMNFRLSG